MADSRVLSSPRRRAVAGALLLLAPACDRPPATPPSERQMLVMATLYPLADLARQIGGDRVRVDWLLDLGDPIEHNTVSRRDRDRFASVDIILCDGLDRTEPWARADLERFRDTPRLISVDQTPAPDEVPADGILCLDPVLAGRTAGLLADALAKRLPGRANTFRARAAAFTDQVNVALAGFAAPRGAPVIVLSNLFQPLLARVRIRQVLVPADPLRLTRTDADAIRSAARASGAHALLVPFDTPPGTLLYLAEQTGLRPIPLDALGYPNYGQHASYLDVLAFNLDQLRLASR